VAGAVLWTAVCTGTGFVFGNVPVVKENFSLVVLGIVAVSLLPIAWEVAAAKMGGGAPPAAAASGRAGSLRRDGGGLAVGFN
jgi:membrane-associated protein